jgi:predicted permease
MTTLKRRLLQMWRDAFGRNQLEHDLDEELRAHIEIEIQQRIDAGESPEAARTAALRELRSVAVVKEATRTAWTWSPLEGLAQDIRYAVRVLRRSPVFSAVVVLSLAIGIGSNTAFFSLVDAMLLRKMPLNGVDELVYLDWISGPNRLGAELTGTYSKDPATGLQVRTSFSAPVFKAFREQSQTLSDVFAFFPLNAVTVSVDGQPDLIPGQLVSGNYFSGLRVPIVIGRTLTDDDDRQANPVALISHRYWQRRFNLDPGVLGRNITLNGIPLTIVGVTAPGFVGTQGFGSSIDVSAPLGLEPQLMQPFSMQDRPWAWWLRVMARVKPDMSYEQVQAELTGQMNMAGLEAFKSEPAGIRADRTAPIDMPKLRVQSGDRGLTDGLNNMGPNGWRASQYLSPLAAISGILLLIVCLNVANLLLARASARQKETGVRLALGAGRVRVIRQMLTEAFLLSLAAGGLGTVFALWGKDLLVAFLPQPAMTTYDLRIDPRVLFFTAGVSIIAAALFGIAPALRATRESATATSSQRSLSGVHTRLRMALLVAQVAMSLVLLVGAGLFNRTVRNLQNVGVGFNADNLLLFRVNPATMKYDRARSAAVYQQLLERTSAIPGVIGSTFADYPLVINSGSDTAIVLRGADGQPRQVMTPRLRVHWNFFETIGIPIVAGRGLTALDHERAPRVAVVNEAFVREHFPAANPVGQHFKARVVTSNTQFEEIDAAIIGVAKDVSIRIAREPVPPMIYVPDPQWFPNFATFVLRTDGDPRSLIPAIREAAREIDSSLPLSNFKTQTEQIQQGFATERMFANTATFFGGIATVLACLGLFGLLAYSVEKSTPEIGLRMALGARPADVVRLVMRQMLVVVLTGVALGAAASLALTPAVSAMLFRIDRYDPWTIFAAILIMAGVAFLSAYLPARRAASVDPSHALRCD